MEINSVAKFETSALFDSLVQTDDCKIIALENRMMFFSLTFFRWRLPPGGNYDNQCLTDKAYFLFLNYVRLDKNTEINEFIIFSCFLFPFIIIQLILGTQIWWNNEHNHIFIDVFIYIHEKCL